MADINNELNQIKNAIYGKDVRGSIHDGIKKINVETEVATVKSEQAHDVMESIINDGFDNAALEANFEQRLNDEIENLQPNWTQFKDQTNQQLAQTEQQLLQIAVNVESFGAVADWDEVTQTGTNNINAFQDAFEYANQMKYPIFINDVYYVDGLITVETDIIFGSKGEIITPNSSVETLFKIQSHLSVIEVSASNLTGLSRGSNQIFGLPNGYKNGTLVLKSQEELIKRHNPPNNIGYTKNDVSVIIDEEGTIEPSLDCSYIDETVLNVVIKPYVPLLTIKNAKIRCIGEGPDRRATVISCNRSNVLFEGLSVINAGDLGSLSTIVSYSDCANISFNNCNLIGANYPGLGYGLSIGNSAFTSIKNSKTLDCRRGITGRHAKKVVIDEGVYDRIDSHWGNDYEIRNAHLINNVLYAGTDISIEYCTVETENRILTIRTDTPEINGTISILKNKVQFTGSGRKYVTQITSVQKSEFDWGRELGTPDTIEIDGNKINMTGDSLSLVRMGYNEVGHDHKPIRRIKIGNNTYGDDVIPELNLWKNTDIQKNVNYNPTILWENERLNGGSANPDNNIVIRDDSTVVDSWGWDIKFIDCEDINMYMDESSYVKRSVSRSVVRGMDAPNVTAVSPRRIGTWIYDSTIKDANLGATNGGYFVLNSVFEGTLSANEIYFRLLKGNSAYIGSPVGSWTRDFKDYEDDRIFL